ncbi:condensation domain-containing protein [Dimargaris cristalligena]|uniref:Condensation domain-containing protein n=1 Tax=Dimargaris cristalligena TaxID=215637 RepID=A0A4P9ZWU4_9FUNG|nr:condensation domain-containing protein [Dimargaris cristalligena]|eukprot:RKP38146.1 condensation domain-containing protein [Dimargaris cristalligena]
MLRARFRPIDGETMISFGSIDGPSSTCFEYHRLDDIRDALSQLNAINHLINFDKGPISQVRVFDVDDIQYVYISVHHLVFDLLSVQIVREDLTAFLTGQTLDPITHSYSAWADHLYSLAQFIDPCSIDLPLAGIPLAVELSTDGTLITNETREYARECIGQSATRQLMTVVTNQLGAVPVELILSALVCAYHRHFGLTQLSVVYSSHGRKDPQGKLDVSRTVGFFACQFPLVLQNSLDGDLAITLRGIQATLSTGMDSGFLRTVTKNLYCFSDDETELQRQFDAEPQFGFTYVDNIGFHDSPDSTTLLIDRPAMVDELRTTKSQNIYPYLFDFAAWNTTRGLEITTHYNSKQFQAPASMNCFDEVSELQNVPRNGN